MIPRNLFFKLKGVFYSLAIFTVLSVVFYGLRENLADALTAFLQGTSVWGLVQNWQFTEWLGYFVLGPIALLVPLTFNAFRSSKLKNAAPNVFNENVLALNKKIDGFTAQMKTLNENVYTFFKYFNPHITANGLSFDVDETSRIFLRSAEIDADEAHRLRDDLTKKAKRIKDQEQELRKRESAVKNREKKLKKKKEVT